MTFIQYCVSAVYRTTYINLTTRHTTSVVFQLNLLFSCRPKLLLTEFCKWLRYIYSKLL